MKIKRLTAGIAALAVTLTAAGAVTVGSGIAADTSIVAAADDVTVKKAWTSGDCTVTVYSDYSLVVSGEGAMADYANTSSDTVAPWCNSSWNYGPKITSITIEEGVTYIGDNAFCRKYGTVAYMSSVTSVSLPSTLTEIGDNFGYFSNSAMTELDFSGCTSLTTIGSYFLNSCSYLTELDLSGTAITSVGNYFLNSSQKVSSLSLPETLTTTGYFFLSGCHGLTDVEIYDSLTTTKECFMSSINNTKTNVYLYADLSELAMESAFYGSKCTVYVYSQEMYDKFSEYSDFTDSGSATLVYVEIDTLEDTIDECGDDDLDESVYMPDLWAAYQTALTDAEEIVSHKNNYKVYSQDDVAEAITNLSAAYAALEAPADYSAVEEAIAAAEELDESDYTADSWSALQDAIDAVDYTLGESEQDTVDAYADAINDAIAALVKEGGDDSDPSADSDPSTDSNPSSDSDPNSDSDPSSDGGDSSEDDTSSDDTSSSSSGDGSSESGSSSSGSSSSSSSSGSDSNPSTGALAGGAALVLSAAAVLVVSKKNRM